MNRTIVSHLSLAVVLAAVLASGLAAAQQEQNQPAAPPPPPRSVIQKLRDFLGINPPVAVGGSRSSAELRVCLLSPWPGQPVGVTSPVLLTEGPLNELRLEQGNQLLWQMRASSTQPIEGPLAWPIRPLLPGEEITLKVRPKGASGGDFATYKLRVSDAKALIANERKAQALGGDIQAWSRFVDQLNPQQASVVSALLSSPGAPASLRESLLCRESLDKQSREANPNE
jgi:hypothetical protein